MSSKQIKVKVPVINEEDYDQNPSTYDFILALLRRNQVPDAMPILAKLSPPCPIFFLGNNCGGVDEYTQGVGPDRVILGSTNTGGTREGEKIIYYSPKEGKKIPVIVGESNGKVTPRLLMLRDFLSQAGIHTEFSKNIDQRQKFHVAELLPGIDALYRANGDLKALAKDKKLIKLVVAADKENIRVLRALGLSGGNGTRLMPSFIVTPILSALFKTHLFEIGMKGHAMAAVDEMAYLEKDFRKLIAQSHVPTPAFDALSPTKINESMS